MDRKIALFIGLNATGHINSLMGVADRLKDEHNFRTVFLVPGPVNLTSIESHGHELIVTLPNSQTTETGSLDKMEKYSDKTDMTSIVENIIQLLKLDPLEAWLKIQADGKGFTAVVKKRWVEDNPKMGRIIAELKPDLIVLDTFYIPPCVITLKDIPWVFLCSANPIVFLKPRKECNGIRPPGFVGSVLWNKAKRNEMRQNEPEKWKGILEKWKKSYEDVYQSVTKNEEFDKLFTDEGLEQLEPGPDGHFSPYLNLYQYPKEIDYDQEDDLFEYPKRWFRCDTFIRKSVSKVNPEEAELWTRMLDEAMKGKEAMIYFSLGTLASINIELMKSYINIFKADSKRLYVISKGASGDLFELNSENMLGANYLPQTLILQRADLAIIHGGNNSILESLYYAVPMIVLPCFADQHDNAQRIDDLNLGKKLNVNESNREVIQEAIDQILQDKSIHERLKEISKNMQNRDDLSKVTLMLKKLAYEKKLDEEFINQCKSKTITDIRF